LRGERADARVLAERPRRPARHLFIIMGIFEIIGGLMLRRELRVTVMSLT
jgi:hypothetical protein